MTSDDILSTIRDFFDFMNARRMTRLVERVFNWLNCIDIAFSSSFVLVIMPKTPNASPLKHENVSQQPLCIFKSCWNRFPRSRWNCARYVSICLCISFGKYVHTRICHGDPRSRFPAISSLDWWCHDEHKRSHTTDDDGEEDGGLFVSGPADVAERCAEEVWVGGGVWINWVGGTSWR